MAQGSNQANFDSISNADAHAQGIDGGLNLKTDPSRLAPPATTRSDNGWYCNPGNVGQLPGFTSTMQANTSHIYNVHGRDLQQPSTNGDVMVHGEVRDAPASATNLFTTPCWSDGNGATLNTQTPALPVTLRTRIMTGRLSMSGNTQTDSSDSTSVMVARQESGYSSSAPQRYALAYYDLTNLNVTFGLVDGQVETPETLTFPMSADYCEIGGVQGTNYWIVAYIKAGALSYAAFDFKGNVVKSATSINSSVVPYYTNYNTVTGQWHAPLTILQHAGRTFVGYVTNPSGSNDFLTLFDVLTVTTQQFGISSAIVPTQGLAFCSPYSHTPQTGTIYLGAVFANQVYVIAQTSVINGTNYVVGGGVGIALASNTGYNSSQSPAGSVNFTTTMAACIFDSQGGVGAGASLGFTVFRHYPEQISQASASTATFWYQQVSADRYQFAANATTATSAGTLTSIGQNVFRTPSGCALISKAFTLQPGDAYGAGLSAAKNAYVMVRCGASEPYAGFSGNFGGNSQTNWWSYGQPTLFIIDHQARVVARMFESQASAICGYALSNNTRYQGAGTSTTAWGSAQQMASLSAPLISAPNNDTSALDITLPAWVQTNSTTQAAFTTPSGTTYFVGRPSNIIYQPAAVHLSLSNVGAAAPAVQAGSYTVLSGAMTCVHDGRGVVEANYHFGTHNLLVIPTTTTTGPGYGAAGYYYYCVIWEWYDSQGRVHRSTPSVGWPAYVASGSYLSGATILCPQPVTAKSAVGGLMYARLYRSVQNNTSGVYYLIGTTAISALSGTNYFAVLSDSGGFLDASSTPATSAGQQAITVQPRRYIDLASSSSLYTYLSMMPPPFMWQVGTKGRAFGLCQTYGQHRLYYTSVQQQQFPFEWNSANYAPIPPDIGDVRSIDAIDDKIVVFGTRSNAVMNGDGPAAQNTTGVPSPNDGFSLIQPIPTPVGIIGSGAPTRIPDGLIFQGYSGIQLVGRDLSVQPIGAAVDDITGRQIGNGGIVYGRGATLAPLQSVVWCTPQGASLVYNYLTQKWSTWPLLSNVCAIAQRIDGTILAGVQPITNGTYAGLATATKAGADYGTLNLSYNPIYQGNQQQPGLVLETPWILPSGESGGESQIWDCTVTGSYLGPHVLQVEQAYDYNNAYVAKQTWSITSSPPNYQYRVRPTGKSSRIAVRYRVSLLPVSTLSAGYLMATLGDLVLNFGAKQGTSRLGAAYSG